MLRVLNLQSLCQKTFEYGITTSVAPYNIVLISSYKMTVSQSTRDKFLGINLLVKYQLDLLRLCTQVMAHFLTPAGLIDFRPTSRDLTEVPTEN